MEDEEKNGELKLRKYISRVETIVSEDTMEIAMPMEQSKLILLPVDGEFNLTIYAQTNLFQCFVRITDRYKSNNLYMLVVELISNLRKVQRREFYRYSCALEMASRTLEEEEIKALESKIPYTLQPGLPLKRSVIVDISGGGLRFISTHQYDIGSLLYCSYYLLKDGEKKLYEVTGRVLAVKELVNRPGTFEHRVEYYNINSDTREEIIRFIFEEERKERRKQNG
ncbi:MAG: flagellar brake protein [Acetatifactor sp.]|nr:flagellar brake protein [Acetatifactor sp.]